MQFGIRTLFYQLPSLSIAMSGGSFNNILKLYIQLVLYYFRVRFLVKNHSRTFIFNFRKKQFRYELSSLVDIGVLEEVFIKKRYEWNLEFDPNTIIDMGAHGGESALYYHLMYPNATIYAIEPDPHSFQRLKKNVNDINNIHPINCAISNVEGSVILHRTSSSLGNSLVERGNNIEDIEVSSHTLKSLFKEYSLNTVDLIKFDIEGAEELVFVNVDLHEYSRAYIGEVHGDLMQMNVHEFLDLFRTYNDCSISTPFAKPGRYSVMAK